MNKQFDWSLPDKFSSPDYLAFLHEFGCAISNGECFGELHAHHVMYRSHGGSDMDAIPLCAGHHEDGPFAWHKIGEEAFCERYKIEEGAIQRVLVHMYMQQIGSGSRPGVKPEARKLARGKNVQKLTKKANAFRGGVFETE